MNKREEVKKKLETPHAQNLIAELISLRDILKYKNMQKEREDARREFEDAQEDVEEQNWLRHMKDNCKDINDMDDFLETI